DRGEEATCDGQKGERLRVLENGQRNTEGRQHNQQREGRPWRKYGVDPQTGEHSEVEDPNRPTLQRQAVSRTLQSQPPTERQQSDAAHGYARQAELNWNVRVFCHVAKQECHAEEQNDDAYADNSVAACKVLTDQAADGLDDVIA